MLSADEKRLRRAQDDAAAFSAEVRQVIAAQRQQIAVLEKQAQQLANEAAAEQRYTAGIHANDKSTKLARLQAEHASLGASLDAEGRHALELASKVELAEMGKHELHTAVSARVPIVAVTLRGKGYDHAETRRQLTFLDTELERLNPGALQVLLRSP